MQRLQSKQEELTEEEEMKQQQRMAIMKDLIKKNRSKRGVDAKNRWWVSELQAKDCEKAWIHTGSAGGSSEACKNNHTPVVDGV